MKVKDGLALYFPKTVERDIRADERRKVWKEAAVWLEEEGRLQINAAIDADAKGDRHEALSGQIQSACCRRLAARLRAKAEGEENGSTS